MHLLNALPQRLDPGATPTFAGLISATLTSPAATNLTLGTGTSGAAITVLSADNNVGIGTVSPSAKLQTQSNYATSANDSDDADATILIENIHASGDAVLRMRGATGVSSVVYGKNGGTDRLNFIPRNDNGQRIAFNQNGVVSISNTTAGASNAGALVVAGGLATGAASYFGGNTTVNGEFRASNIRLENGTFIAFGSADGEGMTGSQSANSLTLRTNSTTALTINSAQAATFAGAVSAQRLEAVDAAANNRAATFIRTQNNTTYSSSVLNIQGDRTTTNASYNLIYATNGDTSGVFAVRDSGNAVNTNNSYGSTSDRKLKENIVDATSKLEKLNQVRIVNFNRIGNEQKQLGVIAQELEQIFPSMVEEAIDRDAEGNDLGTTTKSVKYSVFVPMLIKAIQELTARLAAVEAK